MYRRHFHLKERPFQLVPTPSYLFPSRCHQEALGHLTYALETGEGFVEVTGEVGTGKTTLLRTFLDGLDETVAVACIFNPTLNAVELLQSINRDFGIDAGSASRSDLTAALHRFLIENRELGKKALLVIDEAQNLSIEVLEELRLLSNLETTRAKLLQTVLCGQPELGEMLERHELRQLAQRISLACRLRPLSIDETCDYIVHRLKRASLGDRGDLFTPAARKQVYRYSKGTPRVINICCDRALLCAYVGGRDRVGARSVKEAVAELADRPYMDGTLLGRPMLAWGGAFLGVAIVFMAGFLVFGSSLWTPDAPQITASAVSDGGINSPEAPAPATYSLFDLFDEVSVAESIPWGIRRVMDAWGHGLSASELPAIGDPYLLLSAVAAPRGMEVMPMDGNLDQALAFGLPILMLFGSETQGPLALVHEGEEGKGLLRFQSPKGIVELSRGDAERLWSGRALIACTNPLGFSEVVTERSGLQEVIALESALSRAGFDRVSVDGHFDVETLRAVHALQEAYGILSDGMVGDLTRVALAAALKNGLPSAPERVATRDRSKGEVP
ncbi:AAA family ATPase [Desulfoluna spongiiphila]|uniref:General secretion pathway protein A n=1 Tax=Desulfoluna spongiiphila TaxID=419481 RepID=A0A1G5J202_9BACT|nr:AAA family ATPase [Desulfoluna spongiiphila]SCY82194.1 general secretion pathway protein A [Desulfoluna spongiiphila]